MKYNIHLICNDIKLFNVFNESNLFNKVTIGGGIESSNSEPMDVVIISDRIIQFNDLIEYVDNGVLKANKIFFLLSNVYNSTLLNNLKIRLESKGIGYIPPMLTEIQILERFCQAINIDAKGNKNVIAFFGADSKVGCTITSLAVAESLVEHTSCTVGFLNFQGHISYHYLPEILNGTGLDAIKPQIFSNVLSAQELQSAMIQKGNLYILPGVRTLTDLRYYHPKHVEFLVGLASELFDIVIIDAGSNPNNGLYIGSLNCTSNRYLVATQQESCNKAFRIVRDQIFNSLAIDTESFILVINRYSSILENAQTYKLALANYGISNAIILPNVDSVFWRSEVDCKTLRNYNNSDYNKHLHELSMLVAGQLGVKYNVDTEKKGRGLFRRK